MKLVRKLLVVLLIRLLVLPTWATTFHVTTATFASTFSSATTGDILLLAPGSYGSFAGSNKPGTVTIEPDASVGGTFTTVSCSQSTAPSSCSATGSNVTLNINMVSASHITIIGVTSNGGQLGQGSVGGTMAMHIVLQDIHYTNDFCIFAPQNVGMDIVLNGGDFINIGQSCTEGRLGLHGLNTTHSVDVGVQVENILFMGAGPSDGIQGIGEFNGGEIGPGNMFINIQEGGCGAVHCDAIQPNGMRRTNIHGNFFYNNSTCYVDFNCNGQPVTLRDNIFFQEPSSAANCVEISGGTSSTVVDHNTFGPNSDLTFGNPNACGLSSSVSITNNILSGGVGLANGQSAATFTQDYNLIPGGGTGAHTINGSPTYTGGSTPSTWAGYELTVGSLGHNAASDGLDMGADFSGTPQVATPTFSPVAGTYGSTQSVTISTTTGGATLCYTSNGSTPTADGAGTCTNGTTYSTPVSVSTSETLKAIGSLSGDTDSAVGSAAYVIGNSTPTLMLLGTVKDLK